MRRKRVSQGTSRANSSKRSSAAGSRSMHTGPPAGPSRSAISRAWPPAPKVQSTAISPAAGAVRSISSAASTGTCVRLMSRRIAKALGHLPDLGVQRLLLSTPTLFAPHLQVIAHANHHDLLLDPRVPKERRRQGHSARAVQVDLERVALVEARQLAVLGAHRVQLAQRPLDDRLVGLRGPDGDAGLRVLGENHSPGEGGAEPGRDAQPVLRVQRVLVVAPKRQSSWSPRRFETGVAEWEEPRHSGRLLGATVAHFVPLFNTLPHLSVRS